MGDISKRRDQIDKERREKMEELMGEYDRTVFHPAIKQLIEDCEKEGHIEAQFYNLRPGWVRWWCGKCGASFDEEKNT